MMKRGHDFRDYICPAVMAYNRLNQRVNKLELNYDNFMEEFTAILHRQAFTVSESNKG